MRLKARYGPSAVSVQRLPWSVRIWTRISEISPLGGELLEDANYSQDNGDASDQHQRNQDAQQVRRVEVIEVREGKEETATRNCNDLEHHTKASIDLGSFHFSTRAIGPSNVRSWPKAPC